MIERQVDLNQIHSDLIAALPDNECRYVFYEFIDRTSKENNRSKLFLIVWTPDRASIRVSLLTARVSSVRRTADKMGLQDRMMYTANKPSFEAKFSGGFVEHPATNKSDLGLEALVLELELDSFCQRIWSLSEKRKAPGSS